MLVICGAYSVSAMLDILTQLFQASGSVCIVNGLHATVRDFDNSVLHITLLLYSILYVAQFILLYILDTQVYYFMNNYNKKINLNI